MSKRHKLPALHEIADAKRRIGRPLKFESPDAMWACAMEYFKWATDSCLYEPKVVSDQDGPTTIDLPKMRIFSVEAFLAHQYIASSTWSEYKKRTEFNDVQDLILNIIRTQKFDGAAVGIFNANLVARDLGLAENTNSELSGPGGSPIDFGVTVNMMPISVDGK